MMIDWAAMLPDPPAPAAAEAEGAGMDAPAAPAEGEAPAPDSEIAARERAGDDRRRCTECGNLAERGACLAAYRGEIKASRAYAPVRALLRRCEGFAPLDADPDPRPGRERWPGLIDDAAEQAEDAGAGPDQGGGA